MCGAPATKHPRGPPWPGKKSPPRPGFVLLSHPAASTHVHATQSSLECPPFPRILPQECPAGLISAFKGSAKLVSSKRFSMNLSLISQCKKKVLPLLWLYSPYLSLPCILLLGYLSCWIMFPKGQGQSFVGHCIGCSTRQF